MAQPPTITSFVPNNGIPGTVVTINGTNFLGATNVTFGGVPIAAYVVNSSTRITATVSSGNTGGVSVTTPSGTGNSVGVFTFIVSIASFTPVSGSVGSSITIFGSGFSNTVANNKVSFGGIPAVVTSANNTRLTVHVPSGAAYDKIFVKVQGGKAAQSQKYFNVTQTCNSKVLQPPVSYPAGVGVAAIASGDFNNDGIKDLAYCGVSNVYVRLGLGNGNFGSQTTLVATNTTQEVQIGDFNNDGNQDIIATNSAASVISLFTGTGLGTFSTKIDLTTGLNPYNSVIADFNRDGNLDIAATNNGASTISLLMGNGNGTFQAFTTATVGAGPRGIDVGDINNDGILDLVVANYASASGTNFSILIGNGNGTFQPKVDRTTISAGIKYVKIADLNSDGFNDVVVACNTGSNIARHMGNGTTAMGAATLITNTSNIPNGIALADFNSDGNIDLAITNTAATYLYVANGNGNGTFATPTSYNTTNGSNYLAIGDFDNDGNQDIVTSSNADANVKLLLNKCIPTITNFGPLSGAVGTLVTVFGTNFSNILANNKITLGGVTTVALSATPTTLVFQVPVGASNGKIVVNSSNRIAESFQTFDVTDASPCLIRTFTNVLPSPYTVSSGTQGARWVASGDFNKDGNIDLVTPNQTNGNVSVLMGTGSGTFGAVTNYAVGAGPVSVAIGDYNTDGFQDLAVANYNGISVTILLGTTAGSFVTGTTTSVANTPYNIINGDFNRDGILDLATSDYNATGTISILIGRGDGSFNPRVSYSTGNLPGFIAKGDFNYDGILDLISVNVTPANSFSILTGTGFGTFGAKRDQALGFFPRGVLVEDFNNDGRDDIAITNNTTGNVAVYLATGVPLTFNTPTNYAVGANPWYLVSGDLDGDGQKDILASSITASTVSFLRGSGTGTFTVSGTFPVGNGPYGLNIADYDNDGKQDFSVANNTSHNLFIYKNTCIPQILGFNPANATIGSPFTISGNNFSSILANNTVRIDGINVPVLSASPTQLVGNMPLGVSHNRVEVIVNGILATSNRFTQSFGPPFCFGLGSATTTSVATQPRVLKLADINNDGNVDIITGHGGGSPSVGLKLGGGNLTFGALVTTAVANGMNDMAVVDINNDGRPDAISTAAATISVLTNVGTGFATKLDYTISAGFVSNCLAVGDINKDGWNDVVVAGTSSIYSLLNQGNGTFSAGVLVQNIASSAIKMQLADVNNDTFLDILIATSTNLNVLLGSSSGVFGTPNVIAITGANSISDINIGDYNNDGIIDVACISRGSNLLHILRGNGSGSFTFYGNFNVNGTGPTAIHTADINSDGVLDISVAFNPTANINTMIGSGGGDFPANQTFSYPLITGGIDIAVADINNDGRHEVLGISTGFGTVFLFPNSCPTLSVTGILPSIACGGSIINTTVAGNSSPFLPSNTFTLQLSDASGSFASPTVLRTITTSFFASYPSTLPGGVLPGNNYRVRVVSSHPSITGTGISPALTISLPASISGINPVSVAPGAVVSIFGSNFFNVSAVYFGSTSASSFVVTSSTLIQAVVGSGSTGLVRVATSCNTASFASITVVVPAAALDFDGTNDYVNVTPVVPYSDDFTIEAWIKTSENSGVLFAWGDPVINNYTTFEVYSKKLRLSSGMSGSLHYSDGITDIASGNWTHVAVTRSGNQISLYVNGNLDGTFSTTNRSNPSTSSIGAGLLNASVQGFYKGTMDNLRIWNRPLCQAEINNNRISENPGNSAGLVAHYKFNQGIANSDNGTVTTALDNMGLYNGTLSGFTLNGPQSNWINPGGVAQNSNSTFFPNNTSAFISGFSPTTAFTGQVINISGGNFTGSDNVSAVYFGTTPASAFTVPSSTQILATVGGGNTGVLKLNVGCGTATASGFIYLEPLSISGFTPQRVLPGGALTILGKGFDSDPLANQVSFDGLFALVLAATENMLVVRVPLEASINYIYITTGAQSIKSSFPYFVGNRSCSNSSFTSPILYTLPFGDGPIQISSIDINKDTSLDLVIGNYSSSEIKVQRGDGGGTFSLFNTIPTAASPTVMDFGDVNLDGSVDIVCGNTIGYEVFINDGFANLTQLVLNNGGDNVLGIKLTDLNTDGILDLVYSTPLNPSLYVALGNGLGGFINETAQPLGGMNPSKMVSNDFDKDGNMDIAFVDYSTSNFGVLLGKGNGSFQSVVSYPFGGSAGVDRIVTADFDHDGNYDLAMTSYTDQIFTVFRGNGNGTFTPLASPTNTGGYPNDIQLIDYNGDANIDLIIPIYSTGEVKIYTGNGLGGFSTNPVVISAGSTPNSVAVGDFNRDNQVDFAVTNFSTHQFNVVPNSCPALPKISHNGLWFDGVDDNVTIIRPVQSDFTISFWMKTNSDFVASGTNWYDGAGIIAADNNTPGNLGFGISMTKGYLRYGSGDISTSTMDEGTIKVNDNKWHHVLVTRSESSGDVQLYIDGVREIASTQIVGKLDGTPNLVLGRVQTIPQHAYEGQLDDIRFYDREFSAAEIADTSIWNREANTSDASLVAYYKLDRDPINESELIAKDHIGSNDGTIDYLSSGGPLFTRSVTTAAGDYSPGSLRWAIRDFTEGTDQLSGKNYIDFSIQEVDPNIIHTIDFIDSMSIKSDLVLDGFSAYGSNKNTLAEGSDAQLRIALNFSGLVTRRFGIQLNGAKNSLVRGLSFVGMPNDGGGAHALGFAGSSSHNSISGCWFGVYPDGDGSLTYRNMNGVNLDLDVGYNVIGGPLPEHRNCISNSEFNGIVPNSNYNIIQNNYIGTNPSGVSSMGNGERGISIYGIGNLIKENLISGNTNGILGNGSSSLCTIVGNFIGTDVTGVNPLPNTEGIVLGDGNNTNTIQFYTIGDTTKNNGNIIAFNSSNAITLNSLNSTVNNIRISGNTIFENGYGIFLFNGGNQDKVAPSITSAKTFLLSGTCEADDWVELYYDSPAFLGTSQGRRFLGVANTNGTTWSFPTSLALGDRVTALAIKNTNQGGGKNSGLGANAPSEYNTSEFSSAAIVNSSTPITQPMGNRGIYFDGNDKYVQVGLSPALNFSGSDDFTIETWVKPATISSMSFYENIPDNIGANNGMLNIWGSLAANGKVAFGLGPQTQFWDFLYSKSNYEINKWMHIALVKNGNLASIYINGVLDTSMTLSAGTLAATLNNAPINFGRVRIDPLFNFHGQLDEIKVFNVSRSQSEIQQDMSETTSPIAGMVGYWNMDQGIGTTADDISGSFNPGILTNGPLWALRVTDSLDNAGPGLGSLRQAINEANSDFDTDYIDFSIQQSNPATISTVNLNTPLSDITNPIYIDGYSAFGSSYNTLTGLTNGTNASIRVELKGTAAFNALSGQQYAIRFLVGSDNSIVKGLAMNNFKLTASVNDDGALQLLNTNNTQVLGCFIGTDATGTAFIPNTLGIVLSNSSVSIGTAKAEDRNLIVGGLTSLQINTSDNSTVKNNLFGVSASLAPLTDSNTSIQIWNTSKNNTIGGINTNEGNIIANNGKGVEVTMDAIRNRISQNSIYDNGVGIDLGGGTGNGNKPIPTITSAFPTQVTGSCEAGDIVEVFYDSPQYGATDQGRIFLGQATTSGTTWSFLATLTVGSRITATATDGINGTSPFSVAATVVNFAPGAALDFDGVDDYVSSNSLTLADFGTNPFTVEGMFKTNSLISQILFSNRYDGSNGSFFNIGINATGNIYAEVDGNAVNYSAFTSTTNYADNSWHHVALVREGVENTLYVDGLIIGSFSNSIVANVSRGFGFLVGARYIDGPVGGFFHGQIDEVRLWNRALCQAEIDNNRNAERPGNTNGLLVRYDFNQGLASSVNTGLTTLVDSSGNGYGATLNNFQLTDTISNWVEPGGVLSGSTVASINCIKASALDFDGVDDNVIIPNNSSLNTLPLTVECWMNTTTTGVCYEGLVNKYAASSLNGWSLFHTDGTIQAYYYANSSNFIAFPSTGTGINDGLWHHVAMVVDASGGNIYIDGVLRGRGVWTGTPTACTTNQDLSLGSYPANNQSGACINGYFRGKLDGVRIWSRALCQSEITNNMNAEVPGNSLGLQARYDFNQGFSMSNNAGITTLIDSSGNGNTGTLNNFALVSSTSNWIALGAVVTGSTTTSVNCIPGAALDFNGFNTYVSTNLWSDTLKNFTMEASVYWRGGTSSDQAILYNGVSSSNGYGIVIRHNIGDELTLLLGGSAWILTGTQLPVNSWSKIVAVNDNKNWSLYLNGTALALSSYTVTAITINGITNSYIGNTQSTNSGFNGTIDNVRFWNRPLCQAEINAHLSCEKPANSAGLIARYDFNSGIAGDNNAGVITAIDSSGNGNHGTLTNFALTSTISNWVAPGAVLSGSTCAGVTIPAGGTWIWVGANSDDWFSPCNWDKLSVPTATSDVLIPGGTLNQPSIRNFPAYCNQIEINTTNGGVVNLDSSSGGQLIITQ